MRHKVYGKHLGRDKNQRTALFRGLVRNLFLQGAITTTEIKAKAVKGLVDKLISDGKKGTPGARNSVQRFLSQEEVSKKLYADIVPGVGKRESGFTQVVKLGRRLGDGAMLVKMTILQGEGERVKGKEKKEDAKEEVAEELKQEKKTEKKVSKKSSKKKGEE